MVSRSQDGGKIPKPVKLSKRIVAWRMSDISKYIAKAAKEPIRKTCEEPVSVTDPDTGEVSVWNITRRMTVAIVAGEHGWGPL